MLRYSHHSIMTLIHFLSVALWFHHVAQLYLGCSHGPDSILSHTHVNSLFHFLTSFVNQLLPSEDPLVNNCLFQTTAVTSLFLSVYIP